MSTNPNASNPDARSQAIGARIVEARKELGGMRQEELADLLGVSVRSMQAYESGEVVPYRKLEDLERILGRSKAWILHGADPAEPLQAIRDLLVEIRDTNNQILAELRERDRH